MRNVVYCKTCVMPNSRPRVVFDENGNCNACKNAEEKDVGIDWKERRREFEEILNQYRSKDGRYDCIVPWSGGKDSSAIAYKLKYEYGMNPLLVTFSPMLPNEVGQHNREALIQAGFDHLFFRANQKVHRQLARRFFIERGNPKVAWDAGINSIPIQVAVNYGISLVFYAEHGESEYGGKVLNEESKKLRNFTEVIEHQIGDDPRNWEDDEITEKELVAYIYPDYKKIEEVGVKALYFSYFHKWSMFENFIYISELIDFKKNPSGRTTGTFTDFDSLDDKFDDLYYYLQYVKFGFGRCVRDTSRFIQNNQMNRQEAVRLCKKYDGEFPKENIEEILNYLNMDRDQFIEIIDKHRNEEIWYRDDGEWKLRFPIE